MPGVKSPGKISEEKGTRRLMRTNDRLWKLFASTGSIYAYLMYRQVNQPQPTS
jgi:hypothetical protein